MFTWMMKKVFGTSHDRAIRRMRPKVEAINALEDSMKKLSDAELKAKTGEFKEKLDKGATLDDILVPARRMTHGALARAFDRLYEADLGLKTARIEPELALSRLVEKLAEDAGGAR